MSRYSLASLGAGHIPDGALSGQRAVLLSFSGCPFWDGHRLHRDTDGNGPCAAWCDADFEHGTVLSRDELVAAVLEARGASVPGRDFEEGDRWVYLTGGEPAAQLDRGLLTVLQKAGFKVAIETSGHVDCPALVAADYLIVSPKVGVELALAGADEVKLTLPGARPGQAGWQEEHLLSLEDTFKARAWTLVPQDYLLDPEGGTGTLLRPKTQEGMVADLSLHEYLYGQAVEACLSWSLRRGRWRVSIPLDKYLGTS